MAKTKLTSDEYAINDGAEFIVTPTSTKLKFRKDGTGEIKMTLNFSLKKSTNLQVGPDDIQFYRCGVFDIKSMENYVSGTFSNFFLGVNSNDQIILESADNDFNIITDGEKGNHGSSLVTENSKNKKSNKRK